MSSFVYIFATGCVIAGLTAALMARSNSRHRSSFQTVQLVVVRKGMRVSDVYRVLGHANDIDGYGNGDEVLSYPPDIEVVINQDGVVKEIRRAGKDIEEIEKPTKVPPEAGQQHVPDQ